MTCASDVGDRGHEIVAATKARLLAEGEQRDQARHDLALVYGRFTEGFETADLRIARQLMEVLA